MSTVYATCPSPQRLEDNTDKVLAALKAGSREPQNTRFTEIAFDFLDTMLETQFYGPTRQVELTPFRKKMVDALGGLIEKTSHGLIRSVVSKLNNDELRRLESFVEERRLRIDDKPYVSFPLPQHFTTRFMALHEATMAGNRDNVAEQIEVMSEFVDISLDYMYRRPTELLKLGFVARKAVDLGYSSIRALAHSTIRKLATDLSLEENQKMSLYFYGIMREGPDYRGK